MTGYVSAEARGTIFCIISSSGSIYLVLETGVFVRLKLTQEEKEKGKERKRKGENVLF